MNLILQLRSQENETTVIDMRGGASVSLSPIITAEYWAYRVAVSKTQAVVGFPKHSTIGIGFQYEGMSENTNLPYTLPADYIADHIWTNKGESLRRGRDFVKVCNAIRLIQSQAMIDLLVPQRQALREALDEARSARSGW